MFVAEVRADESDYRYQPVQRIDEAGGAPELQGHRSGQDDPEAEIQSEPVSRPDHRQGAQERHRHAQIALPSGAMTDSLSCDRPQATTRRSKRTERNWRVLPILSVALLALPARAVLALPDLVPTVLTPPASAVAGGPLISVSYTVTNQGDATANPSWRER